MTLEDCQSYRFLPDSSIRAGDVLVAGGYEFLDLVTTSLKVPLSICRVRHSNGDLVPGKSVYGSCFISEDDGTVYEYKTNFEVMTNPEAANLHWRKLSKELNGLRGIDEPTNAIAVGEDSNGQSLYVARCSAPTLRLEGRRSLIPGKVGRGTSQIASVVMGKDSQHICNDFEVLVCD